MKRIIICESEADVELLSAVLPQDIVSTSRFFASEGKSVGVSRARSLLSMYSLPLLLVEDADTLDPSTVLERVDFVRQSLSLVSRGTKFDVAVIVPEMEALFFQSEEIARAILEKRASEALITQAGSQPRKALLAAGITPSLLVKKKKAKLRGVLANTPLVLSLVAQIEGLDA